MAKFKFRLTTLLRLREATRDERRGHLAQAYQADEILGEQELEIEEQAAEIARRGAEASKPGRLNVDAILEAGRYEVILRAQGQHLHQQREAVRQEIDHRHRALVEADRQVKVLEELRQKQQDRHREEEDRRSVKELDEVAGRIRREEAL